MNFNFDINSLGFVAGSVGLLFLFQIIMFIITFFYTWKIKWRINAVNLISFVSILFVIVFTVFFWASHEIDMVRELIYHGIKTFDSDGFLRGLLLAQAFFTYELVIAFFDFIFICILALLVFVWK